MAAVKRFAFSSPLTPIHKSFLANSGQPVQVCVWWGNEQINKEILPACELAAELLWEQVEKLVGRRCSNKSGKSFFQYSLLDNLQALP